MASIGFAIECPHCGRSAFEESYYKTWETFICCYRCGYNYSRTIKHESNNDIDYKESEHKGHGIVLLVNKDKTRELTMLNCTLLEKEIEAYKEEFLDENIDLESSHFIIYENGVFTTLLGSPTDNFQLSFEKYKEKMINKYKDVYEDMEFMVPIEE